MFLPMDAELLEVRDYASFICVSRMWYSKDGQQVFIEKCVYGHEDAIGNEG